MPSKTPQKEIDGIWLVGGNTRGQGAGARSYQSTLAMIRGWRHHFLGNAHAVFMTDSGTYDAQKFLETLQWPDRQHLILDGKGDYQRDAVTGEPLFKDEGVKAIHDNHMQQCLGDPVEYQKIFENKHRCPWFDHTKAVRKQENADERSNARLVDEHLVQRSQNP